MPLAPNRISFMARSIRRTARIMDMARRVAFALVLAALPAPARAAMMEHHDLASLVDESEAGVLAEAIAHPPASERWLATTVWRGTRVYRGALAGGATGET